MQDPKLLLDTTELTNSGIMCDIENLFEYRFLFFYSIGDNDSMSFGQTIIPTKLLKIKHFAFYTQASPNYHFLVTIKYQSGNKLLLGYGDLSGYSKAKCLIYGIK